MMPVSQIKALEYYHDDKTNDLFFVTGVVPSQPHGPTHVEVTACFWDVIRGLGVQVPLLLYCL